MGRESYGNMRHSELTTSYCRVNNIYFNRPITVPPPADILLARSGDSSSSTTASISQSTRGDSPLTHDSHESPSIETEIEATVTKQQESVPDNGKKWTKSKQRSTSLGSVSNSTSDQDQERHHEEYDLDQLDQLNGEPIDASCARQKLIDKADRNCFWSSRAAKKVKIISIEKRTIYIYTLESFSEKRQTKWHFEPYKGGPAYGPIVPSTAMFAHSGASVEDIWSKEAKTAPKLFKSAVQSSEMPNTSFIKTCHICSGRARKRCENCHALGYEVCYVCLGSGHQRNSSSFAEQQASSGGTSGGSRHTKYKSSSHGGDAHKKTTSDGLGTEETCHHCHGGGRRRCLKCIGAGFILCKGCEGQARVRCFLKLIIIWTNHKQESIINNHKESIIPNDRLRLVTGLRLYERTAPKLKPISVSGGDKLGIASVSKSLLDKHDSIHRNELMIKQRHRLTSIDVNIVRYQIKDKDGSFVVYGSEKKTYIDKFPYKTICGIS